MGNMEEKGGARKEVQASYCVLEANECVKEQKFEDAQQWIEKGLLVDPENISLKLIAGMILSIQNRLEEARTKYLELMDRTPVDSKFLPTIKNNLAFVDALLNRPELLEEADRLSEEALKTMPSYPYYRGTRGFTLVQLGRFEEGVKLLQSSLRGHTEKSRKANIACCMGMAAAKQGQESRGYFALARKFDPHCHLLGWESKTSAVQRIPA